MPWLFAFKGKSGFSAKNTAEDVTEGVDGHGLTAIVTGPTSGIGLETARVLALRGVHVVMAARNVEACNKCKETIMKGCPSATIDVMELDVSSLESVRNFANAYLSKGVMACPFSLSKDGIENQFATNYLGHFLLTNLLLDTMKSTVKNCGIEGRIVIVSSEAHRVNYNGGIAYSSFYAYGQSKLANILHAKELTNRLKGASTTCFVALSPKVKGVSGEYFADNNVAKPSGAARDPELAKKLWECGTKLTASKKGASGFSVSSTAEDVTAGIDGTGLTAIVTGVMAPPFTLSEDKIELQFATNHLGHFLLTQLLLETMKRTSHEQKKEGRIVNVSSEAHRFAYKGIYFDNLNDESSYSPMYAYGQSKLANILHANELTRRFKENGANLTANALHPGSIATNLLRYHSFGAATTCYVALHPQVNGISGKYFMDSNVAQPNSYAEDADLAKELWDISLTMAAP
ncbi:NAD(P)-binding domain-containing protein [Cynara cardunculus var. scolymus]|uniref:NAD(P)-binding domain-containing protein n=1 Tax=Cynara cardunculus var. scolymus TaxID=59895 RepID=A0A103XJR2_CYNCS|nr:NAD(P)-binding domain-containing protein [Cynara cardunculus var. scolymus]